MKRRILFMVKNMNVGGTEKALLNMLTAVPREQFDITILMLEHNGGFLHLIPDDVNVRVLSEYNKVKRLINNPPKKIVKQFLEEGKYLEATQIAAITLYSFIARHRFPYYKYIINKLPSLNETYDIAVAYAGPMDFISIYIEKKVEAKKKFQWIHFDVTKIGFNKTLASKVYKIYDKVFVVSEEGKRKFLQVIPELEDKITTFPNIISHAQVKRMAEEGQGFSDNFDGVRILTVGRLSWEKGQDLTITVLARLKREGYSVRWYCVGEGGARGEYERLIDEYGVQEDYVLLGARSNPYPYMSQCNIYVQSSRHEGYCITLAEAKCFSNPIISTDFTGAREQIAHGDTGLIVRFNEQEMYMAIKRLLDDESLRKKLAYHLSVGTCTPSTKGLDILLA